MRFYPPHRLPQMKAPAQARRMRWRGALVGMAAGLLCSMTLFNEARAWGLVFIPVAAGLGYFHRETVGKVWW